MRKLWCKFQCSWNWVFSKLMFEISQCPYKLCECNNKSCEEKSE